MFMNITKEEILTAARQHVWDAKYKPDVQSQNDRLIEAFKQGAAFVQQKLQQTPCSALRDHLDMMLNKEQEAKSYAIDDDIHDEHDRYINAIQRVQVLIDEVYPVA